MTSRTTPRQLLVDMLHQAAELEHCLLNSYLYAACSIKATPQEWASVGDEANLRRAIQFERARGWKADILGVAHEEMRHLHYVQCLIRALGERPHLGLPPRDADGAWRIGTWQTRIGAAPPAEGGTAVPVAPLDGDLIRDFILFESTDALQDEDPFGPAAIDLYDRLYAFEFALRIEGMLTNVADPARKQALKEKLGYLYLQLPPVERVALKAFGLGTPETVRPIDQIRFQSIADLYRNGILPLYEQAFESGWVVLNDRNLVDEQLDPNYAAQGFLPVGPIGRTIRFARFADANQSEPLRDYKRVEDVVDEIVEEGEGATLFRQRAEAMLAKVAEIGSAGYLAALAADRRGGPGYATPDWFADAQMVRTAHLYVFAMMDVEHRQEVALSTAAGVPFAAARTPLAPATPDLRKVQAELPAQFNAAYLGMLAWLARMYESRHWAADKPRRMAIEMLATWPLMSLAVRPMLELAGLVGSDRAALFRYGDEDVPLLPVWAQELASLYASADRSEEINAQMDRLIVRTLRGVASWAAGIAATMAGAMPADPRAPLVLARLKALTRLAEFEKQFPFRAAGGYSDRVPDLTYQNTHPDAGDLSEAPGLASGDPLFRDTLVARIRFRGWGLVQLATDPDPPTDEVGVTGTHMLHAADGDRRFDRALVWQDHDPAANIRRSDAPPLGVDVCEVTLMAADRLTGATAGYRPLGTMNSAGAVQANGVQQVLAVDGLRPIASLSGEAVAAATGRLGVFLETKDGVRPYLNGENHLVWQDGEPIDPFILSVYRGDGGARERLLSREIYNRGRSIAQMEPLERLMSSRGPVGFDEAGNIPGWAATPEVAAMTAMPGYPRSFLTRRAGALADDLAAATDGAAWTQDGVDAAISLAERLALVAQPRGTSVVWLTILLHYGHTLSGGSPLAATPAPLLAAIGAGAGIDLALPEPTDRADPNGRWLVGYTKGLMDTDALSDFVYGELYVPVAVAGGAPRFARRWRFPAAMADPLRAYALDFAKPFFWTDYTVAGDVRTTQVAGLDPADPAKTTTLTETLGASGPDGYDYVVSPIAGVEQTGAFSLAIEGDDAVLHWTCRFTADDPADTVRWFAMLAEVGDAMESALAAHFGPRG